MIAARSTASMLGAVVLLASASARADETAGPERATTLAPKAECVSHLDRAQSLQTARKLRDARASYLACSAPACPELLREDCARSLVELDAALPSFVFSARADGHDVTDARVLLDGEAVSAALDGHAVALDPGTHVVRFERAGGGVSEMRVVAREGERNRGVSATFMTTTPEPTMPKPEAGSSRDADRLRSSCAPSCDQSSRDALSDKLVVANVALGVGIGAIALAAATWLFDPRH